MEFIQYFGNVFEPYNFAILVLGTIGGLLLGATPGLSPTMTVALLIPFTFHMSSVSGLILLGAAYTSTVAGGRTGWNHFASRAKTDGYELAGPKIQGYSC